jgi:hypothetical protein
MQEPSPYIPPEDLPIVSHLLDILFSFLIIVFKVIGGLLNELANIIIADPLSTIIVFCFIVGIILYYGEDTNMENKNKLKDKKITEKKEASEKYWDKFCPKCGLEKTSGDNFCMECGSKF